MATDVQKSVAWGESLTLNPPHVSKFVCGEARKSPPPPNLLGSILGSLFGAENSPFDSIVVCPFKQWQYTVSCEYHGGEKNLHTLHCIVSFREDHASKSNGGWFNQLCWRMKADFQNIVRGALEFKGFCMLARKRYAWGICSKCFSLFSTHPCKNV